MLHLQALIFVEIGGNPPDSHAAPIGESADKFGSPYLGTSLPNRSDLLHSACNLILRAELWINFLVF